MRTLRQEELNSVRDEVQQLVEENLMLIGRLRTAEASAAGAKQESASWQHLWHVAMAANLRLSDRLADYEQEQAHAEVGQQPHCLAAHRNAGLQEALPSSTFKCSHAAVNGLANGSVTLSSWLALKCRPDDPFVCLVDQEHTLWTETCLACVSTLQLRHGHRKF